MTRLLSEIRSLLNERPEGATTGEVVELRGSSVIVKTSRGLKEYRVIAPGQFKVGDRVRLSGEIAVSRIPASSTVPTYRV